MIEYTTIGGRRPGETRQSSGVLEYTDGYHGVGIPWRPPITDERAVDTRAADEPEPADTFIAVPYGIALFGRDGVDGTPDLFRYGCFSTADLFRHGSSGARRRCVPLFVDHDHNLPVGTAELVNTGRALRFRARLDPCAQRRIGTRRSVSPAFAVRGDTTHGNLRTILEAEIREISIVERGRYWPHTSFNLEAAVATTWPKATT